MTECPVCRSIQIVYVVGPKPTTCFYCGATWIQDGNEQTALRPPDILPPLLHSAESSPTGMGQR
jgi:hypothetical protein